MKFFIHSSCSTRGNLRYVSFAISSQIVITHLLLIRRKRYCAPFARRNCCSVVGGGSGTDRFRLTSESVPVEPIYYQNLFNFNLKRMKLGLYPVNVLNIPHPVQCIETGKKTFIMNMGIIYVVKYSFEQLKL